MTPVETILGGLVISTFSGLIGHAFGKNGKVSDKACNEYRKNCTIILGQKIDNLSDKFETYVKDAKERDRRTDSIKVD
jgi:hypothetical protein